MPRVRYKHNAQLTRDEMKIMIKQQLLQVTMLLNQLGEAYRHINDLEELLQKKKEEDEVMNGPLFLGPKFRFLVQKSDFCHTTPILVNDPFLALGMTVNFPH